MRYSETLFKLPDLLLRGQFSFSFDGIPIVAQRLSSRQRTNLIRCGLEEALGLNRPPALPPAVQVEPTNVCNLKCPLCPTGTGSMKRPKGFMSMKTFQRVLDELGESLIFMILYGWGEPFLNKELPRMIEACTTRHICTATSTNGHFLQTQQEALSVVDAGLSALIIAMDGSSQEIYKTYRKFGDIQKVKRCAELIEEAKALRRSPLPYTNLIFVVTRYNQDDLPNVEKLARDLGVNMFSYKSVGCSPYDEKYKSFEPTKEGLRRFEYEALSRRYQPLQKCSFPFRQPTIFWDGTVVGCEYDYHLEEPWGNILDQSFPEIWNTPHAVKLRQRIRHGTIRAGFCKRCPYQDSVQQSTLLSCTELRSEGPVFKQEGSKIPKGL